MFRLPLEERRDPAELQQQAREGTYNSLATFFALFVVIRITPLVLDYIHN